jgi:hypothetical protein
MGIGCLRIGKGRWDIFIICLLLVCKERTILSTWVIVTGQFLVVTYVLLLAFDLLQLLNVLVISEILERRSFRVLTFAKHRSFEALKSYHDNCHIIQRLSI